jgi:4-hydroxymandelate oxidase
MSPSLIDRLDPRDFETVAKLVLQTPIYEWIRSGSDDEQSLKDNVSAFRRYRLNPRVLVDVSNIDLSTTVQGVPLQFPVMVAPIGVQRAAHPDGELGTAAGVAATGALFVEAVNATTSMEDVRARHPELPFWLQLYNWNDRDALAALIARAEEAGASGIVPLVNTAIGVNHTPPRVGYRLPAGVSFAHFTSSPDLEAGNTWEYLEWMAGRTSLPIIPKGIVRGDDAARAVDAGAKGIMVSNHGGRQLSHEIPVLDALPGVVAATRGRAEVYLDGGVRCASDILIALALGARAVTIGRPVAWGLAVGGGEGVTRVLQWFKDELRDEAGLCGINRITDLPTDLVVRV